MTMSLKSVWTAALTALLLCIGAPSAQAMVQVAESFDSYSVGMHTSSGAAASLFTTLNAGTGFSTSFRSHAAGGQNVYINPGPIGNLFDGTAAGASTTNVDRLFGAIHTGGDGDITWQSMFVSTAGIGGSGFRVNNSNGGEQYAVSLNGSNQYVLGGGHVDLFTQNTGIAASTSVGTPDYILTKTENIPGTMLTTSVWINPFVGGGEGGLGAPTASVTYAPFAGNRNIGQLQINNGGLNNLRVDEILFGTTFADVLQVAPPPPPTGSIGWNFVMGNGEQLTPSEVAGLPPYAQANWNNDGPNGQSAGPGGIMNLVDNNGNATTADLAWTASGNSWFMSSANSTPDEKLNDGFLNQRPMLTVSDLPAEFGVDGYTLIVYYNNNEGPGTSDITITGIDDDAAMRTIMTGNTANTRYDEHGYLIEDGSLAGPTNVTVFEGLNDLGFTLSFATVAGSGNNGITALQIFKNAPAPIVVPEPMTVSMLVLAAGALLTGRARRRRVR